MNMSDEYKVVSEFVCCGKPMVTVKIEGRAACVMFEWEYNKIVDSECGFRKKKRQRELL